MNDLTHKPNEITPDEARAAVLAVAEHGGNISQTARSLCITRPKLQRRLRKADLWGISAHGEIRATGARSLGVPSHGVRRYLLTSAQSNTNIHEQFFDNLKAFAVHCGARLMVAKIRYNHTAQQVGQEKEKRAADESLWYDSRLNDFFADDRLEICPGLIWAGDMNIIPTAVNPLSGLDSFTGKDSCIFPHPQIALKSIATGADSSAKMNYTTGAITLTNYIKRKAGLKAEFHHAYGALLVEVDLDGDFFVRQINATEGGSFQDLDLLVDGGCVSAGHAIEVFTPGDIHAAKLDPVVHAVVWGDGGLVDCLKPRYQILHDVLDFGGRSHHNSFFDLVEAFYSTADSVADEVAKTAKIMNGLIRPWMQTYAVKANHDEHLEKWLETADFRRDPINADFYLSAASAKVAAIKRGDASFDLVAHVLRSAGLAPEILFLARDQLLMIAGIRHDHHGDLGPNGARGSALNIARTGEKTNIGHSHSAMIHQGCYQVGTFSRLAMGYNRGPSSWSHSGILTYPSGKRTIFTLHGGKWRAGA